MHRFAVVFVLGLGLLGRAQSARAEIRVSNQILDFAAGDERALNIEVSNGGADRAYVVVEPAEIERPGAPDEARAEGRDTAALGLLVSPRRFTLDAGEQRTVRVARLGERPARDRVYRIKIRPVEGPTETKGVGVRVLVGYDVLVMVRPSAPSADVGIERRGREVTAVNRGNTNAMLDAAPACAPPPPSDPRAAERGRGPDQRPPQVALGADRSPTAVGQGSCTASVTKRLYPGATWAFTAGSDGEVVLGLVDASGRRAVRKIGPAPSASP